MITTVLFDFDGVIYNSSTFAFLAKKDYLKKCGIEFTEKMNLTLLGRSYEDQVVLIDEMFGKDISVEEYCRNVDLLKEKLMENDLKPNPGVKELVEDLKENNIKFSVASSNSHAIIKKDLMKLGLADSFIHITSKEDVKNHKPHPDVFLTAARKLGSKPSECVVIEDATNGVQAARSAGMKVIALVTRLTSREDFNDADLVVDSLTEVNYDVIKNL